MATQEASRQVAGRGLALGPRAVGPEEPAETPLLAGPGAGGTGRSYPGWEVALRAGSPRTSEKGSGVLGRGLPSRAGRGGPRLLVRLWDAELPSAPHDGALLPRSVRSALSGREARKHASRTRRNDRISREWRLVGICGDRHP